MNTNRKLSNDFINLNDSEINWRSPHSQSFIGSNSLKDSENFTSTQEEFVNREELKIKDLQMKIQVLKNGVIVERNKNSENEKEIQRLKQLLSEYETTINQKENMIINISKEKYELQSKLHIEKQKIDSREAENSNTNQNANYNFTDFINGIFQRRESITNLSEVDVKKLQNDITDQQVENEILRNKLQEQGMVFDKCKIEYQNFIQIQMEKIKNLDKSLTEKNKSIDENNKKLEIMFENFKKNDIEKTRYESIINEMTKAKQDRDEKISELLLTLEDNSQIIASYKENLSRHEIESASLARKLAELKNAIIESNMVIQTFRCEKVGSFFNSNFEMTFGRTEGNEYVMKIKEEEEDEEEYVDVEDIEYLKTNEKFMDIMDICYLVS